MKRQGEIKVVKSLNKFLFLDMSEAGLSVCIIFSSLLLFQGILWGLFEI